MKYLFQSEKIDVVMHFAAQSHVGTVTFTCLSYSNE
jgi:UDP-glucose 4-epimerase